MVRIGRNDWTKNGRRGGGALKFISDEWECIIKANAYIIMFYEYTKKSQSETRTYRKK